MCCCNPYYQLFNCLCSKCTLQIQFSVLWDLRSWLQSNLTIGTECTFKLTFPFQGTETMSDYLAECLSLLEICLFSLFRACLLPSSCQKSFSAGIFSCMGYSLSHWQSHESWIYLGFINSGGEHFFYGTQLFLMMGLSHSCYCVVGT